MWLQRVIGAYVRAYVCVHVRMRMHVSVCRRMFALCRYCTSFSYLRLVVIVLSNASLRTTHRIVNRTILQDLLNTLDVVLKFLYARIKVSLSARAV